MMMARNNMPAREPLDVNSEESFKYLTEGDWQLLLEKSRRVTFAREEMIIEEETVSRNIYFLTNGSVRIERQHAGRSVVLARLTSGQVFGEISFVDDYGAAASVISEEPSQVEVIPGDHVAALFASVPGFATRFYMSIATTLARRLRATSERVAAGYW